MNKAFLSLGSNRGEREKHLEKAIEFLNNNVGRVISKSSLYETQPWKMQDETYFINQVVLLETEHKAEELMKSILEVEKLMGRVRTDSGYEPRIIDIDILFFNNETINTPNPDVYSQWDRGLTIPHPLIQDRRFILVPLCEIAPKYIHPFLYKSVANLLEECKDNNEVKKPVYK